MKTKEQILQQILDKKHLWDEIQSKMIEIDKQIKQLDESRRHLSLNAARTLDSIDDLELALRREIKKNEQT